MQNIEELKELLTLEPIEENLFRGKNYLTPWKRVYGGQVLAQALYAARQTVPDDRSVHSMHAYFLLAGDTSLPIVYSVERLRDGGSFSTRRVTAIQKGRPIFNMAASFQKDQEGLDHQIDMPDVPPPDDLQSDDSWYRENEDRLPERFKFIYHERPIEFRPVSRYDPTAPERAEPFRYLWLRAKGKLNGGENLQQEMLAYASDYNLLTTATLPHLDRIQPTELFMASLDHAMWFHRSFRMDEWLLYALDSPSASGTRGFTRGNIFRRDGSLVASVVQEGLIRPWK